MMRNSGTFLIALLVSLGCRREAPPLPPATPAPSTPAPPAAVAPNAAEPKQSVDESPAANAPAAEREPGSAARSAPAAADRAAPSADHAAAPERAKRKSAVRAAVEQQRPLAKQRGGQLKARKSAAAASTKVVPASEEVAAAPPESAAPTARATLRFKNEAGATFKLVEARFVMDGSELPTVLKGAERGQTQQVFSGELTPGRHVIASHLTYQGADRAVFTYMKGYTFRVKSDDSFVARGDQAVAMTIVCKEKTGFNQPIEKRLVVTVE